MSLPSYDQFKAVITAIAAAPETAVKALYDSLATPTTGSTGSTPATSTPSTSTGSSGSTPAATTYPFNVTVLAISGKTLTIATNALVIKDKVLMRLTDGPAINVVGVAVDPKNAKQSIITADQDMTWAVNNSVGKTASVEDRYPATTSTPATSTPATSTPATSTGSSSSTPATSTPATSTPAVSTPATDASAGVITASVNNVGGDWPSGVWGGSPAKAGISLVSSADVIANFVVGKTVTFVDKSTRVITAVSPNGQYYNVWFDGAALAQSVGYPNTVTTPKSAAAVAPIVQSGLPDSLGSIASGTYSGGALDGIVLPKVTGINSRGGKKGKMWCNVGMGAGGTSILPGVQGTNYALPVETEIKRVADYGFTGVRIGFALERVAANDGTWRLLTTSEITGTRTIDSLVTVLQLCAKYGLETMIDAHNYGRFSATNSDTGAKPFGTVGGWSVDALGKIWFNILTFIKANAAAWAALTKIDTMNEPVDQTFAQWKAVCQSILDQCAVLAKGKIFVFEGISYSSTVNWVTNNPDFYSLVHPDGKAFIEFSPHLYLDQYASGYYETFGDTISAADIAKGFTFTSIGIGRMTPSAQWAKTNGNALVVGEHMVPGNDVQLLGGSVALLVFNILSGIDTCIFGISDWFGDNQHNLESTTNVPTLTAYKAINKFAKQITLPAAA